MKCAITAASMNPFLSHSCAVPSLFVASICKRTHRPGVEFTSRLSVVFWFCVFITTKVVRMICLRGKSTWKLHYFTMQTSVVKCGKQHKCSVKVSLQKKEEEKTQYQATTAQILCFYDCLILQDIHACCVPDKGKQRQGGLTGSCWIMAIQSY